MSENLSDLETEAPVECTHPKEQRYMRGWNEVCGVCGQGREVG